MKFQPMKHLRETWPPGLTFSLILAWVSIMGGFCCGFQEPTPSLLSVETATATPPSHHHFRLATPGYRFQFPQDHGSHDAFRTEWWYYTGHLVSEEGRRFGFQLTFFRRGMDDEATRSNPSRWAVRNLYLAHFAVSDVDKGRFQFVEKVSRAALGKAGAETGRLHVWIDQWTAKSITPDHGEHHLQASSAEVSIDLTLKSLKPLVIHGHDGVSSKGNRHGQASHYYSFTRMKTEGTVSIGGQRFKVTGTSWMDHEFGSADLSEDLVGWDWFSLQLSDGSELMCYLLRRADGTAHSASSGTFLPNNGKPVHLSAREIQTQVFDYWTSAKSGTRYPSRWQLSAPTLGLSLTLQPLLADQELITATSTNITYWEGAVRVAGMRAGSPVSGQGYVELTGYGKRFDQPL